MTPALVSPREEAVHPAAGKAIGRASRQLRPALVDRAKLRQVPMRLLEVPADDLGVLGQALAGGSLEPVGKAGVEVGAGLLGHRVVGGIPDQEMAEFEGFLVAEVRPARANELLANQLEQEGRDPRPRGPGSTDPRPRRHRRSGP